MVWENYEKEVSKGSRSHGERYNFNFNLKLIRKWCVRGNGLVRYGFNCYLAALLHCFNILQWINIELLRSGFNCRDDPRSHSAGRRHPSLLDFRTRTSGDFKLGSTSTKLWDWTMMQITWSEEPPCSKPSQGYLTRWGTIISMSSSCGDRQS